MKKIIVVIGMPCSGKSTHARMLSEKLNFKYCCFENIIEDEIKNKTKIGVILDRYTTSNTKIPDEYFIILLKEIIINLKEEGIVFDDFPKTINQAKALDSFLFSRKIHRPHVIFLDIEMLDLTQRIRVKEKIDDVSDTFRRILGLYNLNTKPVVDYYENKMDFNVSKLDIQSANDKIIEDLL